MLDKYYEKYDKKMVTGSKTSITELYQKTLTQLELEKKDYNNKNKKYVLYPNNEIRRQKYDAELKLIYENYYRQMRQYVDETYIKKMSIMHNEMIEEQERERAEEEAELLERTPLIIRNPDTAYFMTADTPLSNLVKQLY